MVWMLFMRRLEKGCESILNRRLKLISMGDYIKIRPQRIVTHKSRRWAWVWCGVKGTGNLPSIKWTTVWWLGGWGRGMWMVEEGIAGIHANGKNTVTKIKLKCVPSLSQWVADSWAMIADFWCSFQVLLLLFVDVFCTVRYFHTLLLWLCVW